MKQTTSDLEAQLAGLKTLDGHLTFQISRLAKLFEQHGQMLLASDGVNLTAYRMLMIIDIFDQITLSDLSRVMLIDAGLISRTAKSLSTQGLINYRAVPNNQRKKHLVLTPKGADKLAALKPRFDAREDRFRATLDADSQDALWHAIRALSDQLSRDLS